MNIFDAILESIQACQACQADIIDSRQCATGEQRSNCKEVAIAEELVDQLRDQIKNLQSDNTRFMYQLGFAACRGKILNMEVENEPEN